jgi:hypothetical protein
LFRGGDHWPRPTNRGVRGRAGPEAGLPHRAAGAGAKAGGGTGGSGEIAVKLGNNAPVPEFPAARRVGVPPPRRRLSRCCCKMGE